MKLRSVYLSAYGYPEHSEFGFETRSLCNYVQRAVRRMRIPTKGFNAIVVQAACEIVRVEMGPPRIVCEKSLRVPFEFDRERYRSASVGEKQAYFEEILVEGLKKAAGFYPLPIADLLQLVSLYREWGRRNEWTHCRRQLKRTGLKAILDCSLTVSSFSLHLRLERRGNRIWSRSILKTRPDELIFHHRFRDVVLRRDRIVVEDRFGEALFELPLAEVPPDVG